MPDLRPADHTAYIHQYFARLPTGPVWPRRTDTVLYGLVAGVTAVLVRFARRVAAFANLESFPPTSFELLPDWERVLGLPDPCAPAGNTIEERRAAVLEKLRRRPGGQSRAYFIEIAERLGYHDPAKSPFSLPRMLPADLGRIDRVDIREFKPFMFGVSRFGDARWRFAPHQMRFVWIVKVPGQRLAWFRFGQSRFGNDTHVRIRRAEDLECIYQRTKPAHTNLIFDYQGA